MMTHPVESLRTRGSLRDVHRDGMPRTHQSGAKLAGYRTPLERRVDALLARRLVKRPECLEGGE